MARRKKTNRLDFETMGELTHNPFAQLGVRSKVEPEKEAPKEPQDHPANVSVLIKKERNKRGGWLTTIHHFQGDPKPLLKKLKAALGAGGTTQDGIIKLQGDHGDRTQAFLEGIPLRVRRR